MSHDGLKWAANSNVFGLTRIELTCLTLVANGYPHRDVGAHIHASEKEVETLLFCAERKLNAKNRLHAISIAVAQGLIGIEV